MHTMTQLAEQRPSAWHSGAGLHRAIAMATFVFVCAVCVPANADTRAINRSWSHSTDTEWVNWIVVNVCPARVYLDTWRSDEKRRELCEDFDPDIVDWWSGVVLNRGDFFTMRGVASSSPTAYEYQEAIGPMWGYALRLFRENGAALRENGGWATFPKTKYGGAHMMCLNAPKWRNTVEQGIVRAAVLGDAVTQDNIGCPVTKYHPGFCTWCNRRFVEHLKSQFPREQLRSLGVPELGRFQIRDYLREKRRQTGLPMWKPVPEGADAEALIRDPLVHEYIRFQYRSMLDAWIGMADRAKREALRLGREVPALYGNQAGCAGHTPLATALSNHVDVVWIESSRHFQPCFEKVNPGSSKPRYREGVFIEARKGAPKRQAWSTLMYKTGRAAGHFRRPVWTIQYPEQWFGPDKRMPVAVTLAEAYANGGVPVMLFGPSVTQEADTEGLLWEVNRQHARFVGDHRALFTDRTSIADVALLLSLPSLFWRNCSSLRVQPAEHLERFTATARDLEECHVPYDVLVLGHPDLYDDQPSLERLRRYRCLVLPHVDCISDQQVTALKSYIQGGGRLVLLGECGTHDEELHERGQSAFAEIPSGAFVSADSLKGEAVASGDLPPSVWLNVWQHGGGPMTSVQMVDYDLDLTADQPRPVGPFRLSLRVDGAERLTSARLIRPEGEPMPLEMEKHGAEVRVTVPTIDLWAIVLLAADDEWETRSLAAKARKWLERLRIASRCSGQDRDAHDELIAQASALLAQIQGRVKVHDFTTLREPLVHTAKTLRQRVEQITENVSTLQKTLRAQILNVEAVKKFDFGGMEAPEGWTPVTVDSTYTQDRGFGWTSRNQMTAVDDGRPDPLHGDYIRNRDPAEFLDYPARGEGNRQFKVDAPPLSPAEFRVDLANGEYLVTVVVGAYEAPGVGSVSAEGEVAVTYVSANDRPVLLGKPIRIGYFDNHAFPVRVTDGQLRLRFSGPNVGPFYHNTIEWLVNGLVIQRAGQTVTSQASESLSETELMAQTALREWAVIGPFHDEDCKGRDTAFGPEREADLTRTYEGKHGRMHWRSHRQKVSGAPGIDLNELLGDATEATGFALTHVQCAEPTDAVLLLSTSKTGAAYVNGKEVLRDDTASGLMLREYQAGVRLKKGWNAIGVRCVSHWSGPWSFWAGVTGQDGSPLQSLTVSSVGEQAVNLAPVSEDRQ